MASCTYFVHLRFTLETTFISQVIRSLAVKFLTLGPLKQGSVLNDKETALNPLHLQAPHMSVVSERQ